MAASLTASIASLVLTLDDPNRDDLDSVIVWASTTSGFTPASGNQVFQGKSLKITIPNLTPGTTYYVKYAYVSTIDTSDYVISSQLSGVPSGVDGSVISDSAITLAKFASGLKPVEIVSTLPSTGNTQGRTVFLTTDNKLYRYNGTAFVSTVPSADLTGQITSTQITDSSITTAKIAANAITANELAANAVTAGKIAAAAVSTTELAANAVTAAKIAAGTITATEIASGAISADKLAANAVTADKIDANAIRSKQLVGNNFYDRGSIVTAFVSAPASPVATTTINVSDTTDFPSSGSLLILSNSSGSSRAARYTGKTSTSLTGVSGLTAAVYSGEIVMPLFYGTGVAANYSLSGTLSVSSYSFPQSGGNAIAFGNAIPAVNFTFTAGQSLSGVYSPAITGISGLGAQSAGFFFVSNPGFPTASISSGANPSSITLSASTPYFETNGGLAIAIRSGVSGYLQFEYKGVSGTTMTLAPGAFTAPSTGTWQIIPIQSNVAVGARRSIFSYDNSPTGLSIGSLTSTDAMLYSMTTEATFGKPALTVKDYLYNLPIQVDQVSVSSLADLTNSPILGSFGFVYYTPRNEAFLAYGADLTSYRYVQPMMATHFFSNEMGSGVDSISFSDATNTYSFNADGGTENAKIASANISVSVSDNTNPALAIAQSGSADALRVTNTGSGNSFVVEDSANPDASPFVIDTVGNVVIGNTSTTYNFEVVDRNSAAVAGIKSYVNNSNSPSFRFDKARGGSASGPTIVSSGDNIGLIQFYGYDGAAFIEAARIEADVGGATGLNDMPGRLMFFTTPDGSSSSDERMRIRSDGNIGIGGIGSATTVLSLQKSITGGTSAIGIDLAATVQSDVTSGGLGYNTSLSTQAASFSTVLQHYRATQATLGAASTVSLQIGFSSTSSLIGATDNQAFRAADTAAVTSGKIAYGFYSAINTATGGGTTYGFYSAGTARNLFSGDVQVFGAGKLGYTTGSGGTATQATSRTTGVTLNKTNGAITLFSTTTTAGTFSSFTVTNNTVDATDTVIVNFKSGATADRYGIAVTAVAAGSFRIQIHNIAAVSVAEAPVINFAVIKAVTA